MTARVGGVEEWASALTAIMGVPTMGQARTFVGLDVHAAKVVAAVVDAGSGELAVQRLAGSTERVVEFCAALPAPAKVTFEAGPTGFGLARRLEAAGVECLVAAPGEIARPAQDRVKTDRRDAELLVRLLMAGQLRPVRVPTPEEEALRDLVRAREGLRGDLMRARHVSRTLGEVRATRAEHESWVSAQARPVSTSLMHRPQPRRCGEGGSRHVRHIAVGGLHVPPGGRGSPYRPSRRSSGTRTAGFGDLPRRSIPACDA
jgi:hypothetical protein